MFHDRTIEDCLGPESAAGAVLLHCLILILAERLALNRRKAGELMRKEPLLKLNDFRRADDVLEEHLGEDRVGGEGRRALIAIERGQEPLASGAGGSENGARHSSRAGMKEECLALETSQR